MPYILLFSDTYIFSTFLLLSSPSQSAYYTLLPCKVRDSVTLPFFGGPTGQTKLLARHPLNNRDQRQVLEQYIDNVLENGLLASVRGQAWAVECQSDGDHQSYHLLTFGTLTEAVYEAVTRAPDNPLVIASVKSGITNALVINKRTPKDVLEWLRDYHNEFHNGSKYAFPELLEDYVVFSCFLNSS